MMETVTGKGTTRRSIRVPDDEWDPAIARAELDGTNISEVLRATLRAYVPRDVAAPDDRRSSVPWWCTARDTCGAEWMGRVRTSDMQRRVIQCPMCGADAIHPTEMTKEERDR